jgi:hypothetical protein
MCTSTSAPFCAAHETPLAASVYAKSPDEVILARVRREHRLSIRRQLGAEISGGRLPGRGIPPLHREDYRWTTDRGIARSYDWHTKDTPTQPSGIGPWWVEPRPDIGGLTWPTDESVLYGYTAPAVAGHVHEGNAASCAGCAGRLADIVHSDGLRPPGRKTVHPAGRPREFGWLRRKRRRETQESKRRRPRGRGDQLTQRELAQSLVAHDRAMACGRYVVTLHRQVPAAGTLIQRLSVRMRCGLRICLECDERRRNRAKGRMEGPWRQFATMTIPHDECARLDAWRNASGWMTTYMERLAKRARKGPTRCLGWECRHKPDHMEIDTDGKKLEYAWVIEPHKTEWPHWHIAWSASWCCFAFQRELWRDVTGLDVIWTKVKEVVSIEGACRYLTKYLTKAKYTREILACLHRKKIWATTILSTKKWENGYKVVRLERFEESILRSKKSSISSKGKHIVVDAHTVPFTMLFLLAGEWVLSEAYQEPTFAPTCVTSVCHFGPDDDGGGEAMAGPGNRDDGATTHNGWQQDRSGRIRVDL